MKHFSKLFQLFVIIVLAFSLPRTGNVFAKPDSGTKGSIWTTTEGCSSTQNSNHYQVGDVIYVHYENFEPGQYVLTIDQVNGPDKPRVEGPTTLTLTESGCFAAHTVSVSEAGNEFTLDLGQGHNDNYGVDTQVTATTPAPTETTPAPTETTPAPTETTPAPTETTPAPTETTPAPTETTPAPTETTPAPTTTTPAPTATTPAPTETTPAPTETTPTPTETTPAPTETTPAPTETTPAPTETTPAPTETTPAPTETTLAPTETTPAPTETTLAPAPAAATAAATEAPVVIPVTGAKTQALVIPVTGNRIIVAGFGHTCMTADGGQVVCWGLNTSGQDGNGNTTNQLEPVYVKDLSGVINLTAGSLHTCALTGTNEVWCWGENSSGQLGNGTTDNSSVPVMVTGLPDSKVINFTAGEKFTCVLLENQEVWCWGENGLGQLNDGTTNNSSTPVKTKITNGQYEISGGQSGLLGSTFVSLDVWSSTNPAAVHSIAGPLSISANRWRTTGCAVASDGSVICWGSDLSTVTVNSNLPALEVGTGLDHNCVINDNQTISCWGVNTHGELGNGTNTNSASASLIHNLSRVNDLAVGANHTCVLQGNTQAALCWGENIFGQLGVNSTRDSNVPLWVYPPVEN